MNTLVYYIVVHRGTHFYVYTKEQNCWVIHRYIYFQLQYYQEVPQRGLNLNFTLMTKKVGHYYTQYWLLLSLFWELLIQESCSVFLGVFCLFLRNVVRFFQYSGYDHFLECMYYKYLLRPPCFAFSFCQWYLLIIQNS